MDGVRLPEAWRLSGVLTPRMAEDWIALKDPSVVRHDGLWHVFCTLRGRARSHAVVYFAAAELEDLKEAEPVVLENHAGYWCAPQVFFYRPHSKWYLVCQAKDEAWSPVYQAAYTTSDEVGDPSGWSALRPMGVSRPKGNDPAYLDFWVIADDQRVHLFFTSDNGKLWRSEASPGDFPVGWSDPVLAYEGDVFEANHVYKLAERSGYLNLIEAQCADDRRYYKAYWSDRLDGEWVEVKRSGGRTYAEAAAVEQPEPCWTDSVSHGELLREESDERMVSRGDAPLLMQGVLHADRVGKPYGEIPWQLGVLTPGSS